VSLLKWLRVSRWTRLIPIHAACGCSNWWSDRPFGLIFSTARISNIKSKARNESNAVACLIYPEQNSEVHGRFESRLTWGKCKFERLYYDVREPSSTSDIVCKVARKCSRVECLVLVIVIQWLIDRNRFHVKLKKKPGCEVNTTNAGQLYINKPYARDRCSVV